MPSWIVSPEASSLAKAAASDGGRDVTAAAIQCHGGIGFTWEADVHWLYKRAQVDAALLGGSGAHRARLAKLLAARLAPAAAYDRLERGWPAVSFAERASRVRLASGGWDLARMRVQCAGALARQARVPPLFARWSGCVLARFVALSRTPNTNA